MHDLEEIPCPQGELALRIVAMPQDTNTYGDIFGGWLVSQMDLAAELTAAKIAKGRTATVSIKNMDFLSPIRVGSFVNIYTQVQEVGRSSIKINVEVWVSHPDQDDGELRKVTEVLFVVVAIDQNGRIRAVPGND